jgi:hypothetical protein
MEESPLKLGTFCERTASGVARAFWSIAKGSRESPLAGFPSLSDHHALNTNRRTRGQTYAVLSGRGGGDSMTLSKVKVTRSPKAIDPGELKMRTLRARVKIASRSCCSSFSGMYSYDVLGYLLLLFFPHGPNVHPFIVFRHVVENPKCAPRSRWS